ncbi:DUF1707 SHOCT-like domain-containing protein [Saccharomonospora iraqiensis]|uniref:DUF1707 SHOCT-like domain-containing protein n=1 Tax=Saccharomonospora iraqiensis TaxID=52698 RepID=UPI00022DF196|nr:DUF1707 domain-containing protein [Saccharomonospora iraqiensis]
MAVDRPEYRLSDAERQEALDALSEHVRSGRLDLVEFDQRSAKVGAAIFRRDLEPLFADLPDPRPEVLRAERAAARPAPEERPAQPWNQKLASLAVPLAAVLAVVLFLTVARVPILIFALPVIVALVAGSFVNRRKGPGGRP